MHSTLLYVNHFSRMSYSHRRRVNAPMLRVIVREEGGIVPKFSTYLETK